MSSGSKHLFSNFESNEKGRPEEGIIHTVSDWHVESDSNEREFTVWTGV